MAQPTRVVLAGVHGHGRWHLQNLRRLRGRGVVLAGVCDPRPNDAIPQQYGDEVPWAPTLEQILDISQPDIAIICTPIHTHVPLASEALTRGVAVLLEKPPAPTMSDYRRLADTPGSDRCQVGFQSLGSDAVRAVRDAVAAGVVGEVRSIGCAGAWVRTRGYFHRSAWAGRRRLDGQAVVDGVLTNPFAHATATALHIVDALQRGIASIEVELWHANPIEADDTSSARIITNDGVVITLAATLCAEVEDDPWIVVHGSRGRITLWYTRDIVRLDRPDRTTVHTYPRHDLLENLVAHARDPDVDLLVPLAATRPFMEVVEAVASAPDPSNISPSVLTVRGEGAETRYVVGGIENAVRRSAENLAMFSELGLSWNGHAVARPDQGAPPHGQVTHESS